MFRLKYLLILTALCLLSSCGDDEDNNENSLVGTWYLNSDSNANTGYTFEGLESGGPGWRFNGNEQHRITWTFNDGVLWTINSENFTTDKKASAAIVGGELHWGGYVYSRTPGGNTSDNNSSKPGDGSDWAPSSMVGKIISWSESNNDGTSGNYDVRVKFNNETDMDTNFSDWCTYKYSKHSSTKAHLNFMAPQRVASTVRTFQYDMDLTFTSASEFNISGSLRVNYLAGPNAGSTYYVKFTGKGKFVDDLYK